MRILLLFSLAFGFQFYANAQADSVLLLNGKVYKGDIEGIFFSSPDSVLRLKDQKGKTQELEPYRVFSYTIGNKNSILYRQDEFQGNYLSLEETRAVTFGSFDARETFKPHIPIWTGFALGLGASIFDTWVSKKTANDPNNINIQAGFFKADPSFFPFLIPPAVALSWSLPSFKLKSKNVLHKEFYKNENFYRGYHRIARQKRMLSSLLSTTLGVGVGMTIFYIAN